MTSINDPIRQASLFTTSGLIDPRLMPGYQEKTKELYTSAPWWIKMIDFFSFGKKHANA